MNEKNYRDITEAVLPKIGFPPGLLDEQIITLMKNMPDSFVVKAGDTMGNDQIQYEVSFSRNLKKPEDNNYYLNSIAATLTKADGEVRKHEFQYFFTNGYNVEQINNIMDGRSVYSEFPKKEAPNENHKMWFALNLNQKDEKGMNLRNPTFEGKTNFSLVIELGKMPFVNLTAAEKNKMLHELKNGNEFAANLKMPDGSIQKAAIVALPHVNQVAAYGMDGKRLQFEKSTMKALPMATAAVLGKDETNKDQGKTTGRRNSATG